MALDGIFLRSISHELKSNLTDLRVEKINQPEKDEIIITLRGNSRTNNRLLISASSVYPRVHLTDSIKPNPKIAPMFCMILRKYIGGSKLKSIEQIDCDRVLIFDFEGSDELGFDSVYSLIVEIMGKHSNITLVRKRDNFIMDSIKHVTADMNTYRCIFPGIEYICPPPSEKINPLGFSKEDLINYITAKEINFNENFFSYAFTGISRQLSHELYSELNKNYSRLDISDNNTIQNIYSFFNKVMEKIKNNDYIFACYILKGKVRDFHCIKFVNIECDRIKEYLSPSKLLEEYYFEKDKADRLNSKSSGIQKILSNNIERCDKKINIMKNTLNDCENRDKYKLYGELLTANIYNIKRGDKKIKVNNYYSESDEYLEISLNENKSPSENIQKYYRKYDKMKKSEEAAKIQLKNTNEEMDYLQSVMTSVKNSDTYAEIEQIRKELMETGYIRMKKQLKKKKNNEVLKPMCYVSSDNIEIYIGKNNYQNDYLTLKFAQKHDIWLHTKNIPGSHVIIRTNNKIVPDSTLEAAAKLAAYYSKARESSKVAVDYTAVRYVNKPNGAKPGMVIYHTNKTIYVDPENIFDNLKN